MSDQPTHNPLARIYKFRRKRRYQGATWTPGTISSDVENGVWCPQHRIRHGYKSDRLGVYYEKGKDNRFTALWYCKTTGAVLTAMVLGGNSGS